MSTRRVRPLHLAVGGAVTCLLLSGLGVASGYWSLEGAPSAVHAGAGQLGTGARPQISRARHAVTIQIPAPTDGSTTFTATRYDAETGGAAKGHCMPTTDPLTCTEADVPLGDWWYAVTPVRENWTGTEGPRQGIRVADPVASVTAGQLLPAAGGQLVGLALLEYLPNIPVTLHIDTPGGLAVGPPVTTDAAGRADLAVTLPALPDGPHTIVAAGADADQSAKTNPFTIDSAAPHTSLTTTPPPGPSGWLSALPTAVHLHADDTGTGAGVRSITYTVNNTPTTVDGADADITVPGDGSFDLAFGATDLAGNVEPTQTSALKVDRVTPTAVIVAPTLMKNGAVLKASGSSTAGPSGLAAASYVWCAGATCDPTTGRPVVGSPTTGPDFGLAWTSQPADGVYTVASRVTSGAGLTGQSQPATVTVDNTPPTVSLGAPIADTTFVTPVPFAGTASDSGTGLASVRFETSPSGSPTPTWSPVVATRVGTTTAYTALWPVAGLNGLYDVRIVATDLAGNVAASPPTRIAVSPQALTVSLKNGVGGTPGRLDAGDSMVITYSAGMTANLLCVSANGKPQLGKDPIAGFTFLNHVPSVSATDHLTFAASALGVVCSIGTIDLGAAYATGDYTSVTYNSTLSYDTASRTLTLTIQSRRVTGTSPPPDPTIVVTSSVATYTWPFGVPRSTDNVRQF